MLTAQQELALAAAGIDPRALKYGVRGNQIATDALMGGAEMLGSAVGGYNRIADPYAKAAQEAIVSKLGSGMGPAQKGLAGLGTKVARFAGSKGALNALKAVPGLGVAGAALGVGDIVFGDESAGNKVMDGALMAGGALLGSAVPVVGTALGAGLGKMASDGIQFLAGGGKSAEERKMEEALKMLRTGGMY